MKNNQTDNTSANVISSKENVNDVNVANDAKAKTLTPRSSNTTNVVLKTRFSEKLTQSKSLDTTSVVSKPKIDVGSASKAKNKWFESQPNVVWSPVNKTLNVHNSRSSVKSLGPVKKWVVKLPTCPCVGSSCVAGDDLLTGGRESNLYTISISDMAASSPVCLILDLVNGLPKFKYGKDHLCSAYERGKSKKASHPPKLVPSDHSKLELLHMDLCVPMRVASINGKKHSLMIVDEFSGYTWVYFLHSKVENLEIIKKFIAQAQLNYKAKVCKIRTDNGTEFKNATLKAHYENLGIMQ
ncbi:retrovirus-related pol polyprotein from transposon TNT 1-94, partial [Tanacetum coccineum]